MKKIIREIILLVIAGIIGFFSYNAYIVSCKNYEKIDEIASGVQNINDSLNDYFDEPIGEVSEEDYDKILELIK